MSRIGKRRRRYGLGALLVLCASGLTAALLLGSSASASRLATTTTAGTTTTTSTTPAPKPTSPPAISGTSQEGQTLTTSSGSWSGASLTFAYAWQRCDKAGGSCSQIGNATSATYKLTSADIGTTLRSQVTAKNSGGSATATSVPTAVVSAATPPPPPAPATGCPSGNRSVQAAEVSAPARLQVASFDVSPNPVGGSSEAITVNVHVTDSCGQPVQGALVYVSAVPFDQFTSPTEPATDASGNTQLAMHRLAGYPAARRQELLTLFIRARKPGDNILAGVSTRRLVSVHVNLAR